MRGTYRFYENGELVGEAHNLITTAGKKHFLQFLAGYVGVLVKGLSVGIGDAAATVNDASLQYEFNRAYVNLVSVDYANTAIVFKGTIAAGVTGTVYEAGLWSEYESSDFFRSKPLLDFSSVEGLWSSGTTIAGTSRIGIDSMRLAPAISATEMSTLSNIYLDLSGYSNLDEFALAYNVNSAFVSSIKLNLYTDATNYYTRTLAAPTAGYKISAFKKTDFIATGAPSWSNITSVSVSVTSTAGGSGSVDFDGLRVEDRDQNSEQIVLISRAVLPVPVVKSAGIDMDFEYLLDLTI